MTYHRRNKSQEPSRSSSVELMRPDPKVLILDRVGATREDPELCDAVIVVGEQEFKVCSTILAMSSKYFKVGSGTKSIGFGQKFQLFPLGYVSPGAVDGKESLSGHQPRR